MYVLYGIDIRYRENGIKIKNKMIWCREHEIKIRKCPIRDHEIKIRKCPIRDHEIKIRNCPIRDHEMKIRWLLQKIVAWSKNVCFSKIIIIFIPVISSLNKKVYTY